MESIDDLLDQIKSEYDEKDNPKPLPKQSSLKEKKKVMEPQLPPNSPAPVSGLNINIDSNSAEYDLLDELKAEFEGQQRAEKLKLSPINPPVSGQKEKEKVREPQKKPIASPSISSWQNNNVSLTSAEYSLIDELKGELEEQQKAEKLKLSPINPPSVSGHKEKNNIRESQLYPIEPLPISSWQNNNTVTPGAAEYDLLDRIKGEIVEQEKAEELKRQQQLKEEQIRQERIKQQQRQALKKEAEEWLKKMNPRSAEGLWFEEFAYDYPSKVEAAIDYLQALKETRA